MVTFKPLEIIILRNMTTGIRVPPYQYVELSDTERDILDTKQVQRLRRIKQLGLSSLVYPGATHTRFIHSIGVLYNAGRLAQSVGLSDKEYKAARIAGLLHDSGHGPYSHASESVAESVGKTHEDLSCEIVDELEDLIPVDTELVKNYITGEADINVVAGAVDADRLDYLKRDAERTGIEHGQIDTSTIIKSAEEYNGSLAFETTAVQALEGFLMARFLMIKSVYNHHTSRISEKMLQRALHQYVAQNSVRDISRMDDYTLHTELKNMREPGKSLYERIKNRNLYKRCLVMGMDKLSREEMDELSTKRENTLESEIADNLDIPQSKIIVDLPNRPQETPYDIPILDDDTGEVKMLQSFSPVPKTLRDSEWQIARVGVYSPKEHVTDVQNEAESVIQTIIN